MRYSIRAWIEVEIDDTAMPPSLEYRQRSFENTLRTWLMSPENHLFNYEYKLTSQKVLGVAIEHA